MSGQRDIGRADIKPCALCRRGVMHTGMPLCYVVRVERVGFDRRAIERYDGLEKVAGHPALAAVFHDGEPLGKTLGPAIDAMVCEKCANEPYLLARIQESAADDELYAEAGPDEQAAKGGKS